MSPRKKSAASSGRRRRRQEAFAAPLVAGRAAHASDMKLQSYQVGALPLINQILERMQLTRLLTECLPPDDPRCGLSTATSLLVLIRNLLISREPVYGVGEWAAGYAPDLLDLLPEQVALLNDDRLGRALTRLFAAVGPEFILAVVRHVIGEFKVSLDELHNDSTTVSFYGAYSDAEQEGIRLGRATPAITFGHSKARRPDLKQLLYTLTISEDGGVPVYFTSHSGNMVDDRTHCATWDLLRQLVGGPGFLYVADCKLASAENLAHIARHGGRFVTVMPRSHGEDKDFRARLRQSPDNVRWEPLYHLKNDDGDVVDQLSVCADKWVNSSGYRLLWYRSTRKIELDRVARAKLVQRALAALAELRDRLASPRTRFRERLKVQHAVDAILAEHDVQRWVRVEITEGEDAVYRQAQPGRPTKSTKYTKLSRPRYHLAWELEGAGLGEAEADDGIFPLLTNDKQLSAEEVLRAYKRQPLIEKRFSQLKTDFAVAPVYLEDIARIQALLAAYFFVLLVQTLLEREVRHAMRRTKLEALPMYPEARNCARPTTHRVIEVFEPIYRHVLTTRSNAESGASGDCQVLVTDLTPLQRQIVELLGLPPETYGR
jgi:transposase